MSKVFKHITKLFFFCFSSLVFSQHISFNDKAVFFKDSIFVFCENNVHKFPKRDLNNPVVVPLKYDPNVHREKAFANKEGFYSTDIVKTNEYVYFVSKLGGEVYKFDNRDSIRRIDNSFTHKMQIGSSLFYRNDTIMRYGGYGFWSNRNIFTYFDSSVNEWEKIAPLKSTKFPEGSSDSHVAFKDDFIVLIGGKKLDKNDLSTRYPNKEIWVYNFKTTQWDYIGDLEVDLSLYEYNFSYKTKLIFFGETEILVIDPFENSLKRYAKHLFHYKLISKNPNMPTIYDDGVFYCFSYYNNSRTVEIDYRNEDEFFGSPIETTKLYDDVSDWWYSLLLLLIPISVFVRKKYRNYLQSKNKIKFTSNGLIFHRVFYDFTSVELQVLKMLAENETVQSADILSIVENKNHNYSHNMRTKVQLIEGLNYKLKMILKKEIDIIISKKSESDKRIIIYEMERTYFI